MNTVIIGAGLAGLAAAHELNKAREKFLLVEKTDSLGGKLKTIQKEINSKNYSLDLGFQVIPSAYPSLQEIISPDSFTKLNPCYFDSGAILLRDGKSYSIGDPFLDASSLWSTLVNPLLRLEDKIRTLILRQELDKYSLEDILMVKAWQQQSALAFLQERRFSDLFLNNFAKPFFGGVFGDNSLSMRASNFAFTLKAFSQGKVFIPSAGIQRLPELIAEGLPKESIKLHTVVSLIKADEQGNKLKVFLDSAKYISADAVILAVEPETLIEILELPDLAEYALGLIKELKLETNHKNNLRVKYHNLYFKSAVSLNTGKKIFLNCNPGALINNGVQISEIQKIRSKDEEGQEHLISVTVLNSKVESKNLPQACIYELETLFPQVKGQIKFLESFEIKERNSLFQQNSANYERIGKLREAIMAKLPPNVFLAGEFMSENCSQEMSIQSGLQAARRILRK